MLRLGSDEDAWFPIVFGLRDSLPGLMYSKIALPLFSRLPRRPRSRCLTCWRRIVSRRHQADHINGLKIRVLNVAEACAGLKSLMTFYLSRARGGFLSSRATCRKLLITLSAIPIAIFLQYDAGDRGKGIIDHYCL